MRLAILALATIAGCAREVRQPETEEAARPADVRAQIQRMLPPGTADRPGWATDVYAAFSALEIEPTPSNLCAALAVAEQESGFRADPSVPGMARIAWEEIDRRAENLGVPDFAVRLALQLKSPTGQSYAERIDAAKTEKDLSDIFEDFIGIVPLGRRLFGGFNPVRTGGPMQVRIRFAQEQARRHGYPYPVDGSIRGEVFTRRGGMYFGIAHLLDYPAPYDKLLYRFADFNAGRYASRNAAFQRAVSLASGIPLTLDGDLVRYDAGPDDPPGNTELAVRALGKQLGMGNSAIHRALREGDDADFEHSELYTKVFELAEKAERRRLPRAVVPDIALEGPKITRKLTTAWFAKRVNGRYRRCLARSGASA